MYLDFFLPGMVVQLEKLMSIYKLITAGVGIYESFVAIIVLMT